MHYRIATAHDLPALALTRWAFRTEGTEVPVQDQATFVARFVDFVAAGMASGVWTYWIAEEDQTIVGQMAVCVITSLPRPSRVSDQWGYLTDVYVRPTHRDRGVGRALLSHVRDWAVSRDLELILVWPSDRSIPFYQRAGFVPSEGNLQLVLRAYDE